MIYNCVDRERLSQWRTRRASALTCVALGLLWLVPIPGVEAAQVTAGTCAVDVSNSTGVTVAVANNGDCVAWFTNIGTTIWTRPTYVTSARVFIVGGGGGGGAHPGKGAGGGGGGGIVDVAQLQLTQSTYAVVVGKGGRGNNYLPTGDGWYAGEDGSQSGFGGIITVAGGGGGGGAFTTVRDGGSGGGGHQLGTGGRVVAPIIDSTVTGAISYGNIGGVPGGVSGSGGGGGGGGATAVGGDGTATLAGAGGQGLTIDISGSGTSVVYGSGGGASGGSDAIVLGQGGTNAGSGVNGNGNGSSGTPNTGSGGGGQRCQTSKNPICGGSGGSGVVIIRYSESARPTTVPTTDAPATTTTLASTTTVSAVTTTMPDATPTKTEVSTPTLDIVVNAPVASVEVATIATIGQPEASTKTMSSTTVASKPSLSLVSTVTPSSTTSSSTVPATVPVGGKKPTPPTPPTASSGGIAAVKVGDSTEQPMVERADNQLIVSAGQMKAVIGALNTDGSQAPLDDDGNVRLKVNVKVRIKLAGFKPNSVAEVWLFSPAVLLGTAKVGADGAVTKSFTIPKETRAGPLRVVIVARSVDDQLVTFAIAVLADGLKNTLRVPTWLIVMPLVLAVGFALFIPPALRQRRKRDNASVGA